MFVLKCWYGTLRVEDGSAKVRRMAWGMALGWERHGFVLWQLQRSGEAQLGCRKDVLIGAPCWLVAALTT